MPQTVGHDDSWSHIVLSGVGILARMCTILNLPGSSSNITMQLYQGSKDFPRVLLNGRRVQAGVREVLKHQDKLMFGHAHAYSLVIPGQPDREPDPNADDLGLASAIFVDE